jgi:AraC family transcriptional regulator
MPLHRKIHRIHGNEFYSLEVYDSLRYFDSFNLETTFDKWAAVQVDEINNLPAGMQTLIVPEGEYAVFRYVGKPSEAHSFYHYLFSTWLPQSSYRLDHRPHMAIMGPDYKGDHPESEEDICIPVSAISG